MKLKHSAMVTVKNKFQNKLNVDLNLRLKSNETKPDISSLCDEKQNM